MLIERTETARAEPRSVGAGRTRSASRRFVRLPDQDAKDRITAVEFVLCEYWPRLLVPSRGSGSGAKAAHGGATTGGMHAARLADGACRRMKLGSVACNIIAYGAFDRVDCARAGRHVCTGHRHTEQGEGKGGDKHRSHHPCQAPRRLRVRQVHISHIAADLSNDLIGINTSLKQRASLGCHRPPGERSRRNVPTCWHREQAKSRSGRIFHVGATIATRRDRKT